MLFAYCKTGFVSRVQSSQMSQDRLLRCQHVSNVRWRCSFPRQIVYNMEIHHFTLQKLPCKPRLLHHTVLLAAAWVLLSHPDAHSLLGFDLIVLCPVGSDTYLKFGLCGVQKDKDLQKSDQNISILLKMWFEVCKILIKVFFNLFCFVFNFCYADFFTSIWIQSGCAKNRSRLAGQTRPKNFNSSTYYL